jgi:excisionase family DNA binding protein
MNQTIDRSATKQDVAFYLRCTVRHVENLMREKKLPYAKFGRLVRFDLDEVKQALKQRGAAR